MTSVSEDACGPTLSALRDLEGVIGSFVLTRTGDICSIDHLGQLAREGLRDAGPRIARLVETLAVESSFSSCWIRFVQHRLLLRPLNATHLLGVLTAENVNQPALRMATTLALRKLTTVPLQLLLNFAPTQSGTEFVAKRPAEPDNHRQPAEMFYRGQRVTRG